MSHLIAKKWGVVMLFLENGSRYKIMFIKLFSIVRGRFDIPQKSCTCQSSNHPVSWLTYPRVLLTESSMCRWDIINPSTCVAPTKGLQRSFQAIR
jgi:hypothetical protein